MEPPRCNEPPSGALDEGPRVQGESKIGVGGWSDELRSAPNKLAGIMAEVASLRDSVGSMSPSSPGARLKRLRACDVNNEREFAYMQQILQPMRAAAAAAEESRRPLTYKSATESGGQHGFDGGSHMFASGSTITFASPGESTDEKASKDSRESVIKATGGGYHKVNDVQSETAGTGIAPAAAHVLSKLLPNPRPPPVETPVDDANVRGKDAEGVKARGIADIENFARVLGGTNRSDAPGIANGTDVGFRASTNSAPPNRAHGEGCPAAGGRTTAMGYLTPRVGEREHSRRECQILDERIGNQFRRVEDRMEMQSRQSQKLQDVLQNKVAEAEVSQSRLERRMFELVGTVNGLSDETQQQVRRVESMDARLLEFRHDLQEQFQQRFRELQTEVRNILSRFSAQMATSEQQQSRQQCQLEEFETERHERGAKLTGAILELRERLEAMAATQEPALLARVRHEDARAEDAGAEGLEDRCWHMEKQLTEVGWKLDRAVSDMHEKTSCLAEHEERFKRMQAKLESQDPFAMFYERIRHDWEAKFTRMQKSVREAVDGHGEHAAELALARRQAGEAQERHDRHEAAIQGLATAMGRLAGAMDRLDRVQLELTSASARLGALEGRMSGAEALDAGMATLTEHAQALGEVQRAVARQMEALNGGQPGESQ